jgi:hypothetical protein
MTCPQPIKILGSLLTIHNIHGQSAQCLRSLSGKYGSGKYSTGGDAKMAGLGSLGYFTWCLLARDLLFTSFYWVFVR